MANVHGFRQLNNDNKKSRGNNGIDNSSSALQDKIPFLLSMKSDRQPIQESIPYTLKLVCCPDFKICSTTFIFLVAIWVMYLVCLLQGVQKKNHQVLEILQTTLLNFGGAIGIEIKNWQVYRLITASFLHANLTHIIMNSICLLLLCTRFQKLYPSQIPYVLLVSSITGFLLSVECSSTALTVGASTSIFGALGGFVAYLIINWTALEPYNQIRSSITCTLGIIIFVALLLSIGSSIDAIAHIGGLIGGLFMSLAICPGIQQKSKTLTLSGIVGIVGINFIVFLMLFLAK